MSDERKGPSDVYRYSSVGIQMVLMICLCTWCGIKLDAYFETSKSFWTAGMALFGVIAAIIYILRVVGGAQTPSKKKKQNDEEKKDK